MLELESRTREVLHSSKILTHSEGGQHPPLPPALKVSPRRHAAAFIRKRDVTELYSAQSEQLSILASAVKQTTSSSSRTSLGGYVTTLVVGAKRKRFTTQRRRDQCRDNQARYRNRQREYFRQLQESVEGLREEVQTLAVKRHTLCYGVQTKNSIWHVVVEYFRLFRYGYLTPLSELNLGTSSPNDTSTPLEPNLRDQEWFLRSAMSSDIAVGELSGVDALIEQWRRYSTYFGNLNFQLKGMEEQPFGAMIATASLSLSITETSLRRVFPHLLARSSANIEDSGHVSLWSRLLGQRLNCRCSLRFEWDDSTGRVTQLDCKMDLITPLLRLLGNLEDVNRVLEKALITPANLISDLPTNTE